jgi:hypothetical protein
VNRLRQLAAALVLVEPQSMLLMSDAMVDLEAVVADQIQHSQEVKR